MGTKRTFQDMLNEYLTYDLLREEMKKRDYVLGRIDKDDGWKGGTLPVPFKAAGASSLSFGELTQSNDIAQDKYIRGEVSSYNELWGAMIFNHKDIVEHDGSVKEKSFLKIFPDSLEDFLDYMKQAASLNMLNGEHFAQASADGGADGTMIVDRPDRFILGQKVVIKDDNSAEINAYVSTIEMNTRDILFVTTRNGATPVDLSTIIAADNAKIYHPGALTSSFTSMRSSMLSAANGGTSALYGQTKTSAPYLQSINVDGTSWDAANFLTKLFDAYTDIRKFGRGNPNEVLVSYKNLGSIMKLIESSKGAFKVAPTSEKASLYGWTEIEIVGVKGRLKVVGLQEADDDVVMFVDWRALKFHSNGMFRKHKGPDGNDYYVVRGTQGYQYICDMYLFGELVLNRPSYCGIVHTIDY